MDFNVIEPLISQTYSSVQSLHLFKLSAIQLMKKERELQIGLKIEL